MPDLADFALQEQPEDNLMVAISPAWYNGSYTMAAKPIKSLDLIALYNDPVFNSDWYSMAAKPIKTLELLGNDLLGT